MDSPPGGSQGGSQPRRTRPLSPTVTSSGTTTTIGPQPSNVPEHHLRASSPTPAYRRQIEEMAVDEACADAEQKILELGVWQDSTRPKSPSGLSKFTQEAFNSQTQWQNGQLSPKNREDSQPVDLSAAAPPPIKISYADKVAKKKVDPSKIDWRTIQQQTIIFSLTNEFRGKNFTADKLHDILSTYQRINVNKINPLSMGHTAHGREFHLTLSSHEEALELMKELGSRLMQGNKLVAKLRMGNYTVNTMRVHWLPQWVEDEEIHQNVLNELRQAVSNDIQILDVKQGLQSTKWGEVHALFRTVSVLVPCAADIGKTPCFMEIGGHKAMITVFGQKNYCFKCMSRYNHDSDKQCNFYCTICVEEKNFNMSTTHKTEEHVKYVADEEIRREARRQAETDRKKAIELATAHTSTTTKAKNKDDKEKKSKKRKSSGSSVDENDENEEKTVSHTQNITIGTPKDPGET